MYKLQENVRLIPKKGEHEIEDIKRYLDKGKMACVCDFHVKGEEEGDLEKDTCIRYNDMLFIDHHANIPEFRKAISSTNMAINYVERYGILEKARYTVMINHTDCDSILSMGIMTGMLKPEKKYWDAAISADHTGEPDQIADLLQCMEYRNDPQYALEQLYILTEKGKEYIDNDAKDDLKRREDERTRAEDIAREGLFKKEGHVTYAILEKKIDSEILVSVFPRAEIIMFASPMEEDKDRWEIKARLGRGCEKDIDLNLWDLPDFGGRWNAGSTKRNGGTDIDPKEYARMIDQRFRQAS